MAREADPRRELARLEEAVKQALPRAVLLRGDEPWFRAEALRHVLERARAAQMELARHDASDPDFELPRLLDDLAAAPMFASARCVVVRGADGLLSGGGRAGTPLLAALKGFLGSSLPGALVLDAPGLRADHAAARAIADADGIVVALRKLYDSPPPWGTPDPRRTELVEWTQERARGRGLRLSPDEALLVATASANDLSALEQKLDALSSGAVRERGASLERALGLEAAASPFEIAAEMLAGRVERAVPGLEALFRLGFVGKDGSREVDARALGAVLGSALRSKLRQAERVARALAAGADAGEALSAAGVPAWPKAREELTRLCNARPPGDWPRLAAELLELERRTRRGGALVDVADYLALALSWRRPAQPERARAAAGARAYGAPSARAASPRPGGTASRGGGSGRRGPR